jgi:hypothetical protein
MITPVAIESLGYQYYIVYAVLGGCIPLGVYFFYPETMGRSLEQMDQLFRDNTSIASVVRASLKRPAADDLDGDYGEEPEKGKQYGDESPSLRIDKI